SEAEVRERNQRQFRAVMAKVDALLAQAQADANAGLFPPVLAELLKAGGDTQKIWAARKTQLLKMFVASAYDNSPTAAMDAAYDAVAEVSNGAYTKTERMDDYLIDDPMSIYEEAVWNATNPLIQNRYRSALRGYEGGYWANTFTFGVIGWHGTIKPFAERKESGIVLGMPLTAGLGGTDYPGWSGPASNIFTSNPLEADTDLDGMDDYFEVFHGLNPVLGDYVNAEWEDVNRDYTGVNRVGAARARATATEPKLGWNVLTPSNNGFGSLIFNSESVTGFDYYTYPWLAGVPFADPDGDGLLNFEEAVNPVTSAPAHYGTDPSPLWMTDPANTNSFVARFYTRGDVMWMGSLSDDAPTSTDSIFPYEINEGYDTDGDGIGDNVELVSNSIFRGDPQTLRTPDRQQAAYFGGAGAMQTMADTQFGPQALTTFTVECWVKPDADQASDEVVLIDRPWRFNDGATTEGAFRHNFVVGLSKKDGAFNVFAYYTGAGTNTDGSEDTPKASPKVVSGQTINANEWNHIAVTYDGARLVLLLNGVESSAQASGLIPANGVLSVKSTIDSDVRRFTYRKAPIMIGAAPAATWKAALGNPEDAAAFNAYFTKCFKGFIDEVRIWNGARTAAQIADARGRALTQTELLTLRYNAFIARYNGMGYFQANTPAEPLAIYTFNDLLAGSRDAATDGAPAQASDKPWEAYPSQQLMGADEAGSFTFRRKGFLATREAAAQPADYSRLTLDVLPTEAELFTSYYTLSVAKNLRSTKYAEGTTDDGAPTSEFVPKANNTVAHLPLADVVRAGNAPFTPMQLEDGSPELTFPSGTPENLKVADSFYWSPYRAGEQVSMDPIYSVKTTGNPYGYLYHGSIFFDALDYISRPAFATQYPTDIFVYGDVFAKYDFETWDNSPSTDPAAGKTTTEAEGADWFRHQDTPSADTGDKLNDKYFSQGGYWLEQNIANGQTKDTDGDRMPNWWENYYGLDPEDPTGINGPHGDQDGDFLTNYAEHLASANPLKFSTVGNGVPDAQIPIWFRRGAPTFGMLYTDNDFMEDHWEASNRTERLTVDLNDAARDADGDGWSNFAEARANFRSGYHSTNPNAATSISQTGKIKLEMPTPA
ncbi:MAG: LamG domain-containing protein, partial [Kiritimatiellae bacterium]|nr:LamG domain-containing protein [Kiritimatiellia bacterium]